MISADTVETSANDADDDNQFSRLDPRRFTPSLHAQLVGEILKLRESSESKSKLILGLEEQLSLAERENIDLERLAQAAQHECRGLRRQLQLSEGGSDSALEKLQQERDSLTQAVDELKKRADALQSKLKCRDTDVERINSLWESDRRSWNEHRRAADRKSHVAESRIKLLADELEALYKQTPGPSQTLERGHKRQFSQESHILPDLNSSVLIQDDCQKIGYDAGENHTELSLDKNSVQAAAQATLRSLADELEADLRSEDSDDYEDVNALPEEQPECTRAGSSQLGPEAAKARRILGLDVLEENTAVSHDVDPDSEDSRPLQEPLLESEASCQTQLSRLPMYRDRSTQWSSPTSSMEKLYSLQEPEKAYSPSERPPVWNGVDAAFKTSTESFKQQSDVCEQCCGLRRSTFTQGCQTNESSFGRRFSVGRTLVEQPEDETNKRRQDVSTQTLNLHSSSEDVRRHLQIECGSEIPKIYIRRPNEMRSLEDYGPVQLSNTPRCYKNALVQTLANMSKEDDEHASLKSNGSPSSVTNNQSIATTTQPVKLVDLPGDASRILHVQSKRRTRSVGCKPYEGDAQSGSRALSFCSSTDGRSTDLDATQKFPPKLKTGWQTIENSDTENSRSATSSSSLNGLMSGDAPSNTNDLLLQHRLAIASGQKFGQSLETQQRPKPPERWQQTERSQYLDHTPSAENFTQELFADTNIFASPASMTGKVISTTATGSGEGSLEPPFPVPKRSSSKRLQYDLDVSTHSEGMATFLSGGVYGTKLVDAATFHKHQPKNLASQKLSNLTLSAPDVSSKELEGQNALRSKKHGNGEGRRETNGNIASMSKDKNPTETDLGGLSDLQSSNVGSIRGSFVSDSINVVDAIAQTMVGEWMWKYVRKRKSFGLPETPVAEFELGKNSDLNTARHQRWVWVAPYERAIMWSSRQPTSGAALMGKNGRKLVIQSVLDVRDETPLPKNAGNGTFCGRSILILTAQRALKFTAKSQESHYMWLTALSFLSHSNVLPSRIEACVNRPGLEPANMNPPPASLEKRASNLSLRKSPRGDSIRLAKSRSAQGLGQSVEPKLSKTKSPWTPDRLARPIPKSIYPSEYTSESEGVAEPPLVPRFSNQSRKKNASGLYQHKSRSLKYVAGNWVSNKQSLSNSQLADDVTGIFGKRAGRTADGADSSLRQSGLQKIHSNKTFHADGSRHHGEVKNLSSYDDHTSLHRHSSIHITNDNFFEAIGTVRMEAFVQGLDDVGDNDSRADIESGRMDTEMRDKTALTNEHDLNANMSRRQLRKVSRSYLHSNPSMMGTAVSDTRKTLL